MTDPVRRLVPTAALVALWACSMPTAPAASGDAAVTRPPGASGITTKLVELTNAERTRAGVPALRADDRLTQAAQMHAEQMASLRRVEHVLSDARYPRPADRLEAAGYIWQAWAENLATGYRTPAEAVEGWMRSSEHRQQMLNATFTELGAGHAIDAAGQPYYVQVFGRPMS